MLRSPRLFAIVLAAPLTTACASGGEDSTFSSGVFSGSNSQGGSATMGEDSDGTTTTTSGGPGGPGGTGPDPSAGTLDGTGGTMGGGDGNPLCCEAHPQPGCESPVTESCVCTVMPTCCSAVWTVDCVAQAIECGDPYCVDDPSAGTAGPELDCDPSAWSFTPADPAANVPFIANFTDPVGLTWVGMSAAGPGGTVIDGSYNDPFGTYTWPYDFPGLAAGMWTFTFTHRETEGGPDLVRGTCEKQIQ